MAPPSPFRSNPAAGAQTSRSRWHAGCSASAAEAHMDRTISDWRLVVVLAISGAMMVAQSLG
jgi:hypothetical protein